MKHIEVVAGVIFKDGLVFAAQRNEKGEVAFKWEFPGGKIEPGESHAEALKRELNEELGIDVSVNEFLIRVEHSYLTFHLTMHAYSVHITSGEIKLKEHVDFRWLRFGELSDLDWAAADLPIVDKIESYGPEL